MSNNAMCCPYTEVTSSDGQIGNLFLARGPRKLVATRDLRTRTWSVAEADDVSNSIPN